jgi:hypothetical protein
MITEVKGNIFNFIKEGDYLIQQVNTEGVMRRGIAKQIKELFPDVNERYETFVRFSNKFNLLGACQTLDTKYKGVNLNICNCFAQDLHTYYDGHLTNYEALEQSLKIALWSSRSTTRFLLPKNIGCGIGGGDWKVVYNIIERVFVNREVLIVDYDGSELI